MRWHGVLGLLVLLATAPALAEEVRLTLVNATGREITQFYASPSRASDWGQERLGGATLAPGSEVEIATGSEECLADLMVTFAGGAEEERLKQDLCRHPRVVWGEPPPEPDNPSFSLVNGTGQAMTELSVTPSGHPGGNFDLLLGARLEPGASIWISLPGGQGCLVDVAYTLADGTRHEWPMVATCASRDAVIR